MCVKVSSRDLNPNLYLYTCSIKVTIKSRVRGNKTSMIMYNKKYVKIDVHLKEPSM